MAKNMDVWVQSAVESFFEVHPDPVTKGFLLDYLRFTVKEKDWLNLPDRCQAKLVSKELVRLQNKKKIHKVEGQEVIQRENLYQSA